MTLQDALVLEMHAVERSMHHVPFASLWLGWSTRIQP